MRFSSLPNELILMIWNFAKVEDVYNFSTVSMTVYLLVREPLREHCRLSKRLSRISNVGAESGEPGVFGRILKGILLNPRAARYPSLLEVDKWKYEWDKEGGYSRSMIPDSDLELFKQAVRSNVPVPQKSWFAGIDEGDEEPLIALLLLLLPNLRKVRLSSTFESSDCIEDALKNNMHHNGCASLRKLHTVDLRCAATADSDYVDFEQVWLFAELPSVAWICGQTIGSCPENLDYTLEPSVDAINVVSLNFMGCLSIRRLCLSF